MERRPGCKRWPALGSGFFSDGADATGRADIDTQRGIVVAVAFRTGGGVNLEENLAGGDRFGRTDRFAITAGSAHISVDFHCHDEFS
jgi:hypothetical protein